MFVGIARFDLRIPDARSLKDKRAVMRSLTTTLRQKFNCAVAEVDYQDAWQRAAIGVSVVAETRYHAQRVLHEVQRRVEAQPGAEVINASVDLIGPE
jgi:hypothetical protein